jgi:hypothetical protein
MRATDLERAIALRDALKEIDSFINARWMGALELRFGSCRCTISDEEPLGKLWAAVAIQRGALANELAGLGVDLEEVPLPDLPGARAA